MVDYSVVTAPRNTYLGIWDRLPQDKQNIYKLNQPAVDNTRVAGNDKNSLRTHAKPATLDPLHISRADKPAETKSIQALALEQKEYEKNKPGATQHGVNMQVYHSMKKAEDKPIVVSAPRVAS